MIVRVLDPDSPLCGEKARFVRTVRGGGKVEVSPIGSEETLEVSECHCFLFSEEVMVCDPDHRAFGQVAKVAKGEVPEDVEVQLQDGEKMSLSSDQYHVYIEPFEPQLPSWQQLRNFYKAGRYYRYPLCCTLAFCWDVMLGLAPGQARHIQLGACSGCPVPCGVFHRGASKYGPLRRAARIAWFYFSLPLPGSKGRSASHTFS